MSASGEEHSPPHGSEAELGDPGRASEDDRQSEERLENTRDVREASPVGSDRSTASTPAPPLTQAQAILPQAHAPPSQGDVIGQDPQQWRQHIRDTSKLIPIPLLTWDHDAHLGQVRPLKIPLVTYYVQKILSSGEPVRPVDVMTKLTSGVYPHLTMH